jgi:hypothetical protein
MKLLFTHQPSLRLSSLTNRLDGCLFVLCCLQSLKLLRQSPSHCVVSPLKCTSTGLLHNSYFSQAATSKLKAHQDQLIATLCYPQCVSRQDCCVVTCNNEEGTRRRHLRLALRAVSDCFDDYTTDCPENTLGDVACRDVSNAEA